MYKSEVRAGGDPLRAQALRQLHRKRGLRAHAISYGAVNLLCVVLWRLLTPALFFWPLFPMVGWGIGLAFHVLALRRPSHLDDERVEREIGRIRRDRFTRD
jgi:hypothetical protein